MTIYTRDMCIVAKHTCIIIPCLCVCEMISHVSPAGRVKGERMSAECRPA